MTKVTKPDANPVGGTVELPTSEFRALTDQLAELTERVGELEQDAFKLMTLEELWFKHERWTAPDGTRTRPRRRGRPGHLSPVDNT